MASRKYSYLLRTAHWFCLCVKYFLQFTQTEDKTRLLRLDVLIHKEGTCDNISTGARWCGNKIRCDQISRTVQHYERSSIWREWVEIRLDSQLGGRGFHCGQHVVSAPIQQLVLHTAHWGTEHYAPECLTDATNITFQEFLRLLSLHLMRRPLERQLFFYL